MAAWVPWVRAPPPPPPPRAPPAQGTSGPGAGGSAAMSPAGPSPAAAAASPAGWLDQEVQMAGSRVTRRDLVRLLPLGGALGCLYIAASRSKVRAACTESAAPYPLNKCLGVQEGRTAHSLRAPCWEGARSRFLMAVGICLLREHMPAPSPKWQHPLGLCPLRTPSPWRHDLPSPYLPLFP
jgi:hypothetical protein